VVITHLHTDHAGGLVHVTGSRVWVAREELARASGVGGPLQGSLRHRWPKWWQPEFVRFDRQPLGPFEESMRLTERGDVVVLPTPGHTPHHVSALVSGDPSYLIAGDTSYNQALLVAGKVDGVSPDPSVSKRTLARILALAERRPLVYLPSHDPESATRLANRSVLEPEARSLPADARRQSALRRDSDEPR
jgi:glyoxylase-like metal-dependent hydrolase (beta-lactamase superfamily II)